MTGPTYILTGGAGFVGSNLAAELVRREPAAHILVVDDFRSGSFANLVEAFDRAGIGPFRGEVVPDGVENINLANAIELVRPAAVFHLGAITDTTISDEKEMLRVNTETFPDILDACIATGVPLVYASSAATYGTPPQTAERRPFPLDAAGRPSNVYGFSKWLMEAEHARRAARERAESGVGSGGGPHVVGLRYFNVFGPGESRKGKMASMVYQLASRMLAGQPPRLFEFGEHARDQVPVEDVVSCTIAAAAGGVRPGVYNLGSGVATSFNEIIAALREALDMPESRLPTEYFPMPPAIRAFYQDYTCADMSMTAEGLGWSPSHRPADAIVLYARRLREEQGTSARSHA